ncbi:Ylf2p NDAI_0B01660 [Naumovozyma dairenensis CBS 421]|uniref:OBG-type G domain-containing protein n=1 Tax=Naumovozyma dairenensis (strain ATCC 10597 / BCRC 20456 / CBS 421 / NBRC 0211 / NRRL Y-12639) TaxID=1071378 RepID=G0W5Y9_NAUDC|nr:hypothetical protein NDAI_0B01660 [Naumovozyma dairenensis CBS 421]CCD23200.1 hypothetical protein NDAI_0B01660 [Naumovozyma dairenensis CBS 421]
MSHISKHILGRPSNNLTSGIVGLANIGKSTFFQAITNSKLSNPANYPFATINPEECLIQIPNDKLTQLQQIYNSSKTIKSTLTVTDIAGLIRGASQGNGLGNKFLNDIRFVDGIFHLVRGFIKDDVEHVERTIDPVRDLAIVQDELILKDLEYLENAVSHLQTKAIKKKSLQYQKVNEEIKLLNGLEQHLYSGKKIIHYKDDWTKEEVDIINKHHFLTAKPTIILLNTSPRDFLLRPIKEVPFEKGVVDWADEYSSGDKVITISAEYETKYIEYMDANNEEGFQDYCKNQVGKEYIDRISECDMTSSMPLIIQEMKKALDLISFFTCGPLEVREWNLRKGSTAKEAAGIIHTDLEDTFINADIIHYLDLLGTKMPYNESYLKSKSFIHRVGKQYIIQDNDIALFKATKGKKR